MIMIDNKTRIRSFLRKELNSLLPKARNGLGPFSTEEIENELNRRNELERKREDKLKYPELSHS